MIQRRQAKLINRILLLVILLEAAAPAALLRAAPGPDLAVFRLVLRPRDPVFLSAVSAEVVVQNAGDPSDETTVTLQWCCGEISRSIPALDGGETAAALFEHSLVFPEPGIYQITAVVDPADDVTEDDETNNSVTETLVVGLGAGAEPPADVQFWGDGVEALACSDTDLMGIGRKLPFVMEDLCPGQWGGQDPDGCPRRDLDGDNWFDEPAWLDADDCTLDPGPDGEDIRGCPPEGTDTDLDGDGIADDVDDCPEEWGFAGGAGMNGCPLPDSDGDGTRDPYDDCPLDPGPVDDDGDGVHLFYGGIRTDDCPGDPGPNHNRGCPVPGPAGDQDGDGVEDAADGCPAEWGFVANGGCPNAAIPPGCPVAGEPGDEDGDGLREDRLSRVIDSCERTEDQDDDHGCQVYLTGQRENACGTTSLAYVIRYLGKECCREECGADCIDDAIRCYTGTDMFTDPIGIKEYAEEHGLNAEIYVNGDVEELRWFTDRGIPIILEIANTAGSTDVNDGHYVVVTSFCEVEAEFPAGATRTVIGIYDPHSRQFGVSAEYLEQFWGRMEYPVGEADVPLWSNLYIAVSDQTLPPGNSDEVRSQLALAQGLSTFMTGGQDFADIFEEGEVHRALEGIVELAGGAATTVLAVIANVLTWGGDLPLVGGMLDSLGDLAGDLTLVAQDLVNAIGDLFNPENWTNPEQLGRIFVDIFKAIGEGIVALFEGIWNFIVEGIGGFFKDIWEGLKALGCDWFGIGCPHTVVYYKHYPSPDQCLETSAFVNGLSRVQALGFIFDYPAPGTSPLYLFAAADSPTTRTYRVCEDPDFSRPDVQDVRMGIVGYTLDLNPGPGSVDMKARAREHGLLCDESASLGYLPSVISATTTMGGTTILWLMQALENDAFTVATDPCASTQTFVTPVVDGYTREIVAGYLPPSETEGALPLYRLFNPGNEDALLTTMAPSTAGFALDFEGGDGLAVGDVNGDGREEIIHGDRGDRIRVFDKDGTVLSEFSLNFEGNDGLAAGDVNGDGRDEIIHGDRGDWIQVFDMDGNRLSRYELDFDEGDGLAAGDVNGDGVDEIVHGDRSDYIRVLDMTGARLSRFDLNYERDDGLAVGDVNGDGVDEIVHGDRDDYIRVMDITGERLVRFDRDFERDDGLAVGDIDGDGVGEIIHGDRGDWIQVLSMDGAMIRRYELDFEGNDGLASGDLDGDGIDEVVHGDRDDRIEVNPTMEGYVNQGYVGHIYTDQVPGTAPLYQFHNSRRKDHLVTLDPGAEPEGLENYGERELLGYVLPPDGIEPDDLGCNLPLWRFCKRIRREE